MDTPRPRAYISGPIISVLDYELEWFRAAETLLWNRGYEPVNPLNITLDDEASWVDYMRAYTRLLTTCDVVVLLPNWEHGRNSVLEKTWATHVGMSCFLLNGVPEVNGDLS